MAVRIESTDEVFRQGEKPGPMADTSASDLPLVNDQTVGLSPSLERVYRHRLLVRISH
ncbi:MAG: hypothetical protein U0223_15005 [Nitrospira sp.]|nr:hypothetical protein [Nitrospira sp.]